MILTFDVGYWANVVQIVSIVFPTVIVAGWAWWHLRCRVVWCFRPGRHKVSGTTWRVCDSHHTHDWHLRLFEWHQEKHPDRLGHGESHDTKKRPLSNVTEIRARKPPTPPWKGSHK